MSTVVIEPNDHRAVQDAYWEQIEFGSEPSAAINLAMIVYLQRHPRVPSETARACVNEILKVHSRSRRAG